MADTYYAKYYIEGHPTKFWKRKGKENRKQKWNNRSNNKFLYGMARIEKNRYKYGQNCQQQ